MSLDALDDRTFRRLAGVDYPVSVVLEGIDAAIRAGFAPVKLNMVVQRGVNESQILPVARFARERGIILRFIEYMDAGQSNGWRRDDVVGAEEILARLGAEFPVGPALPRAAGQVAERFRYVDGAGEIGVVASVTRPFCGDCSRIRLTVDGRLFTCLFGASGADLRDLLRGGAADGELASLITSTWRSRSDRYSQVRSPLTATVPREEMAVMGG